MHERKKIHNYWISRYSVRKVFFRDSIALSESYESFYKYLDEIKNKIEYFLIESATPSWDHDYKLIKEITIINKITGKLVSN